MNADLKAEGYYTINPKIRAAVAFGPIIKEADFKLLTAAHQMIDDTQIGMLAEVRYLTDRKDVVHSTFYMPPDGYGDVNIPPSVDGLVNFRKIEFLNMPMNMQCAILRYSLENVIDKDSIDCIESMYRMNIPLSDTYLKLLEDNAVFCQFFESKGLCVNDNIPKYSVGTLLVHGDNWCFYENHLDNSSELNA